MYVVDGGAGPPVLPNLILVTDGLIAESEESCIPHPALEFIFSRLRRASKQWVEVPLMTPIEWYANLLGVKQGASSLLAEALGDSIPADARQCWLLSPFAGRLGRDKVHIMPDEAFAWDKEDTNWLMHSLQPLLSEDGFTLLSIDKCILAVTPIVWDVQPVSFALVAGKVLPNRHPAGTDGGRLMRLCAEMQMHLAARPSERRRSVGMPNVMGVWMWASSRLPVGNVNRPPVISNNPIVHACVNNAEKPLPVSIMQAVEVEAKIDRGTLPRHWLLAGDGMAVLLDMRTYPRFSRNPWLLRNPIPGAEFFRQLRRVSGIESCLI